jgi:uncharacterized cupredoxin-like copper-binding protein
MRVRAWRRLMLIASFTGLFALGAVACAETPEVVIRPDGDEFRVIGTIGDETHFHLLNDSDRDLSATIVALHGHSVTELREEAAGGDLPEWATEVGTLEAAAGEAADGTFDTGDGGYAVVELTGEAPLVAELHREEPEEGGEGLVAAEGGDGGEGGGEGSELPPLPEAGAVGSATGTVAVTMEEFSVAAQPNSTASGQITFNLENEGAVLHELVIVRTEAEADALPISGGAVDETDPGLEVIEKIQNVQGGASGNVTAGMPAGSYVLICNVPGHYNAGMHTEFTVQ